MVGLVLQAPGKHPSFLPVLLLIVGKIKLGIDQIATVTANHIGEYPQADAYLGGGKPRTLRVIKRLGQVLDQGAKLLVEVRDGVGGGPQQRIAKQSDRTDRHIFRG